MCPTKKRGWKRRRDAVAAMKRYQVHKTATVRSVYKCKECGEYHMTSQSQKPAA